MSTLVQKLSSRKLWLGVALVVIGIVLCATGDTENGVTIIKIGGIGYLGAETVCDIIRGIWSSVTGTEDEETETVEATDELSADTDEESIIIDFLEEDEE